MPDVPKYDGTSDPHEHSTTNTTAVKGNDLAPHEIEFVLLKKFGETLTRGALTWYSPLPEHSIDSFEMLADSFIKAHAGARKVQARKADIFRITQGESESLCEFITRFQKERMLLPGVQDEWAVEAFTKGLNSRSSDTFQKLKESLLDFQAMTWADVHNRYESKIKIEDDQVGFPLSAKGREKNKEKSKDDFDADRRTNGHRTGDCRHLREEVVTLLKNGHLREFLSDRAKNNYGRHRDNTELSKAGEDPPRQTINMIFGENEINKVTFSAEKKMKVSITHSKRLREASEDDITFVEEDADGLLLLHNDASKHHSIHKTPRGFNLVSVTTQGEICLPTNAERVMKTNIFEVVDGDTGYNIILGRPWLQETRVVPSTYHQLLKSSTPKGIKQIKGDQPVAREMNAISISNSKGKEHAA
ncbi:uncharacterized protein [Nicotiana tomentosiformis]|uniref:uncharacterized protein n=1 Tax=Nicotiana tomentosiformis TaxID=4098 RepID=UPI00388CE580